MEDPDDLAARMEAKLEAGCSDGWMSYVTRTRHLEFEAGSACKVRFVDRRVGRGIEVKFDRPARINANRRSGQLHVPMPEGSTSGVYRPKRSLWYFVGLENKEEADAVYYQSARALKPY